MPNNKPGRAILVRKGSIDFRQIRIILKGAEEPVPLFFF